jgi:hypothetical protein
LGIHPDKLEMIGVRCLVGSERMMVDIETRRKEGEIRWYDVKWRED